jgi:nucleotide-binding universal stress UspA family protein
MQMARRSAHPLTVLYVERVSGWSSRLFGSVEGKNLSQHLDKLRAIAASAGVPPPEIRRQTSRDVIANIANESAKGYDLMLVGASESRRGIRGEKLEKLIAGATCHVAIVKHRGSNDILARRLLVPIDGSFFSRVAVEFAIRYAEGRRRGEVTMALVDQKLHSGLRTQSSIPPPMVVTGRARPRWQLEERTASRSWSIRSLKTAGSRSCRRVQGEKDQDARHRAAAVGHGARSTAGLVGGELGRSTTWSRPRRRAPSLIHYRLFFG